MVACALHKLGPTFRGAVGISLVKLIAPSVEKDAKIAVGSAAVLALVTYLAGGRSDARRFQRALAELTREHLSDDHDYIWMKVADAAEALNLE